MVSLRYRLKDGQCVEPQDDHSFLPSISPQLFNFGYRYFWLYPSNLTLVTLSRIMAYSPWNTPYTNTRLIHIYYLKIQFGDFTIKSANIYTIYFSLTCLISKYHTFFGVRFVGFWGKCMYLQDYVCLVKVKRTDLCGKYCVLWCAGRSWRKSLCKEGKL
jgi:hypothetical protein